MNTVTRQSIENQIMLKCVSDLLTAGYTLGVNDGESTTVHDSTDKAAIMNALRTTDEDLLLTKSPAGKRGYVRFVYGNDGHDVINDNTLDLEDVLAETAKFANSFD